MWRGAVCASCFAPVSGRDTASGERYSPAEAAGETAKSSRGKGFRAQPSDPEHQPGGCPRHTVVDKTEFPLKGLQRLFEVLAEHAVTIERIALLDHRLL